MKVLTIRPLDHSIGLLTSINFSIKASLSFSNFLILQVLLAELHSVSSELL